MSRGIWVWLGLGCWLAGAVAAAPAAGRNEPLTTAKLLVDLARDYGLRQHGQQTEADVQHVRALLQAAVRLDPKLPDPYVWLYELAVLEDDQAVAARMLTGLLNAEPRHQGAFTRWLAAGVHAQQTIEKRAEWLKAVAATRRPPALQAQVHVALAHMALEQMDPDKAQRHITRALELEPASIDAAILALEMLTHDADPTQRLRAALLVLQLTPQSVSAAWQAAAILDDYGFPEGAARFYEHALDLHRQV
ncbi:MAG: hypothetical protein KAY37_14835, partial [Phycisphaerae bacterium]|nr:hypothetical protein [Phycisphaerae bacterium]